ncbi:protein regulator of cytokinesis 1a isoform X2 [Engraulis encrasicolus]|uniref:protein regulator of cytokinesis 1a isoform X2 n=1 Tax=Engraulis encrasicolus TaxID=184585 RepID=UPI002FD64F90
MRKSEVHASESVACLNKALNHLKDIWEEIGIPEDQRLQRVEAVHMHVKNLLDMMISEEEGLRKRVLASIETCQKDLDVLCKELRLEAFQPEDGCTMLQLEKDMRTRLKDMIQEKTQRIKDLTELREQDKDLCDILCSSLHAIDMDSVPSAQDLDAYRAHLATLREERNRRHAEFVGIKKQIICCMEELEQEPDGSFERDVVHEDEDAFCLSTDNIAALQLLLSQLESRRAENEALCTSYRTRIQELWDRLQTPAEEREELQEHMTASRKRNREALLTEVQRLEELKIQNIQNFIQSIREEIVQYWNMCFYSHQQRQAFGPYFSEDFSEELLGQHEAELENLKKHFDGHKELFTGVEQWEQNWTLYQALEKKATDPGRFNNRGGNLLKEEKQRADLQKSLPKLEKSLKGQIDQWEQEQGRDFLVNGQKFMEYVQEQWEVYREEREREKLERQMKKSKQTEEDMLYGTIVRTPSKRRMAATPTPGKTRRMNNTTSTMSTPNSTLRSANGVPLCHSPVLRPPLSANKVGLGVRTPGRGRTPLGLERNKENMSLRNMAPSPQKNYSINSVASTYSEFARELSSASKSNHKKGSLNSTITHS